MTGVRSGSEGAAGAAAVHAGAAGAAAVREGTAAGAAVRAGAAPSSAAVRGDCDGSVARDALWTALEGVEDPELPVSVTDLGLVRRLEVRAGHVRVGLTYTSLACPCTEMLREDVQEALEAVPGVASVEVDDVLEPWSRADISPRGLEQLRAVAVV